MVERRKGELEEMEEEEEGVCVGIRRESNVVGCSGGCGAPGKER